MGYIYGLFITVSNEMSQNFEWKSAVLIQNTHIYSKKNLPCGCFTHNFVDII